MSASFLGEQLQKQPSNDRRAQQERKKKSSAMNSLAVAFERQTASVRVQRWRQCRLQLIEQQVSSTLWLKRLEYTQVNCLMICVTCITRRSVVVCFSTCLV